MKTILLIAAVSILLCAGAAADEVTLKGGGKFNGIVEEKGDKIVVRMEHGTVTFDRDRVDRIDRSKSSVLQDYDERLKGTNLSKAEEVEALLQWAEQRRMAEPARELRERLGRLRWEALDPTNTAQLEEFAVWAKTRGLANFEGVALQASLAQRRKKVDSKDAEGLYQLGLWAKTAGLPVDAIVLFQQSIAAQPEHEFARRALGYQSFQGKWMTPNEVKVAMGLLEFEGDWMTPQAKESILTARTLEKERKLLEETRKKLDEERAKARAEFESQRAVLESRLAEITARVADIERRRAELAVAPVLPLGCPAGVPNCLIVTNHVHCSRAGCTYGVIHFHCSKAGCNVLSYHAH